MPTPTPWSTLASIETTGDSSEKTGPAEHHGPGRRILRFRAAGTACACDLEAVREIVRTRAVTRLPGAAPWVLGIMNVRGALLTVVDLSARLRGAPDGTPMFVMVVEGAGRRFGIGVESVQGVADIAG
ncbi:MAG TPA: chemotaxis protein CheW, partial [Gemmatimonadaceae bacterium]|nr:chemotaxis protein CheW [Gemmatimonadaceae bacterium]